MEQQNSEHDQYELDKELKTVDDHTKILESNRRKMQTIHATLIHKQSPWDELIDVKGEDVSAKSSRPWGSLSDAWWPPVGSYLSEAMSYKKEQT